MPAKANAIRVAFKKQKFIGLVGVQVNEVNLIHDAGKFYMVKSGNLFIVSRPLVELLPVLFKKKVIVHARK